MFTHSAGRGGRAHCALFSSLSSLSLRVKPYFWSKAPNHLPARRVLGQVARWAAKILVSKIKTQKNGKFHLLFF